MTKRYISLEIKISVACDVIATSSMVETEKYPNNYNSASSVYRLTNNDLGETIQEGVDSNNYGV